MITIFKGDITDLEVDAIVNAANSQLIVGGGVDRAIHKAAGLGLQSEVQAKANYLPVGEVLVTHGHLLPSKLVIHTVAPHWQGGHQGELRQLAQCYKNAIQAAIGEGVTSIAFPSLGTGAFGIPIREGSSTAFEAVLTFDLEALGLEVVFCLFSDEDKEVYLETFGQQTKLGYIRIASSFGAQMPECPVCFWPTREVSNGPMPSDAKDDLNAGAYPVEAYGTSIGCDNCGWEGSDAQARGPAKERLWFLCLDSQQMPLFSFEYAMGQPVPGPIQIFPGAKLDLIEGVPKGFLVPNNHEKLGEMWIAKDWWFLEPAMARILKTRSPIKDDVLDWVGFRRVEVKPRFQAWQNQ